MKSFSKTFFPAFVFYLFSVTNNTTATLVPNNIPIYDVAVIGAGPSGLATCIGLQRTLPPSKSIAIFERAASLREVGGQVGLFGPAFPALNNLDPSEVLAETVAKNGIQRRIFRMLDQNNQVVSEREMDADDDSKQIVISWFQLQKTLLDHWMNMGKEVGNEQHGELLKLGHELVSIKESDDDNSILLEFSNGEQCRARIVIGADGNLSRVRSCLFEEEVEPEYAGSCIWRMFLEGEDYSDIELGESNVWSGDGKVLAVQKFGVGADSRLYVSGQSGWKKEDLHLLDRKRYIGVEDGKDSGGMTSGGERLQRFLDSFEGFPTKVLDFVRKNHVTASILEHPIYYRPVGREWGKGRVTLIGDAAHMMPPNMAMGTPSAFEDAVSLSNCIHRHGLTPEALRAYEEDRQPRVNKIAFAAIKNSGLYYQKKDDEANPFKLNDAELFQFIMNFKQDAVPAFDAAQTKTEL